MIIIGVAGGVLFICAYVALVFYGIHLRRQNPRYWDKKLRHGPLGPDDVLKTGEHVSAVIRDGHGRQHHIN